MDKRVEVALVNTLDRFEKGHWLDGRWSDGKGNFCLLGSLEHELGFGRGRRNNPLLYDALEQLGFVGPPAYSMAYSYNDMYGRRNVIELLRKALKVKQLDSRFAKLHLALDESRRANAKRDLGRKVPDTIPAAWEQMRGGCESENGDPAAVRASAVGEVVDTLHL